MNSSEWIVNLINTDPWKVKPGEDELILAINAERKAHGLSPLRSDSALSAVAQEWAHKMATTIGMKHGAFGSRISHVFPNHIAAEDIAAGQRTVTEVVKSWMNSPPHRANILGDFDLIGAGKSGTTTIYWCLDFVKE